jgi:hypothetical protein
LVFHENKLVLLNVLAKSKTELDHQLYPPKNNIYIYIYIYVCVYIYNMKNSVFRNFQKDGQIIVAYFGHIK